MRCGVRAEAMSGSAQFPDFIPGQAVFAFELHARFIVYERTRQVDRRRKLESAENIQGIRVKIQVTIIERQYDEFVRIAASRMNPIQGRVQPRHDAAAVEQIPHLFRKDGRFRVDAVVRVNVFLFLVGDAVVHEHGNFFVFIKTFPADERTKQQDAEYTIEAGIASEEM